MIFNISAKNFAHYKETFIDYNQITITKLDIKRIPELMNFFMFNNIYIDDEIKLTKLSKNVQNEIGKIFMNFYGYMLSYQDVKYLNYNKLKELFKDSSKLLHNLAFARQNTSKYLEVSVVDNIEIISFLYMSEEVLNNLILNFFYLKHRNFISADKYIKKTDTLYDANLEINSFYKITDTKEFIVSQFERYIRTIKGSIPFSSNYGSNFKKIINSKYDIFTKKILEEEIKNFFEEISSIYNNIELYDISISYSSTISGIVKIKANIILSIDKKEYIKIDLI